MKNIFFVLFVLFSAASAGPVKEVTNQEIRDTILSLVHSYHQLDNKLERHEHRERALGEMVKKALHGLQKGQKAFEPMNGIFSRLDERVSQIETMLMAQEEKYNTQSDKFTETLDKIFKWMTENNECFNKKLSAPPPVITPSPQQIKNEELLKKVIEQQEGLSQNLKDLMKTTKEFSQVTEKLINTKLESVDEFMVRIEDKLTNFYITVPATQSPDELKHNKEFETKVENYLENITTSLVQPFNDIRKISDKIIDINESLNDKIKDLKTDIVDISKEGIEKVSSRVTEAVDSVNESINKIVLNFNETVEIFYNDLNGSYTHLAQGLKIFNDFDKIFLQTSDHILNTQKKIEFSTHQIVQKISEVVKNYNEDLNLTLQKRIDDIDEQWTINRIEAVKNLSKTIESEISHVWRQIEVMNSEVSDSKTVLKKIESQTESYINGTIAAMDGMEGNVGQITSRIVEVDSNLNFLLGRLSLVSQEFNRIKTGLGSALDEIRNSFQAVKDKIKEVGPGPHKIPDDGYEPDLFRRD